MLPAPDNIICWFCADSTS